MNEYRAAVVAVGSELLSGQITNRNAAWISSRMSDLGFDVRCHYTVDDVESEIVEALRAAAAKASFVFVTGGLGPTSDDLTRQAVAQWAGRALEWDEASWQHVVRHFESLQLATPTSNRQQCYFPQGARVLTNRSGTANAFMIAASTDGATPHVFVLPGPPREVDSIWTDHIAPFLHNAVPAERRLEVRSWRTIGRGESLIGEMVGKLAEGSKVDVAYRAHPPFVETKLRFAADQAGKHAPLIAKIDAALAPWLFEADGQDAVRSLAHRLLGFASVNIYDGVGRGVIGELLAPFVRDEAPRTARQLSLACSFEEHEMPELFVRNCLSVNDHVELVLAAAGFGTGGEWAVGVKAGDATSVLVRSSPYRGEAAAARNQKAVAWLAVRAWLDLLEESRS